MELILKRILRRNKIAREIFYRTKRLILYPLRLTKFKNIALSPRFPLRDLWKFSKISLLNEVIPYTLLSYTTLSNVYELSCYVGRQGLPGAFVECGVWKGGSTAVMGAIAHRYGSKRKTWYFDSFEGMPDPTAEDVRGYGKRGAVSDITGDTLKASVSDVEEIAFTKLQLPRENNIIVKGWFKDTLPMFKREIGDIAILRLDGDWYESTKTSLTELYDQIIPGGYVIVDDYGSWDGCRKAVHEFLEKRHINADLKFIGTYDPQAYERKMMPGVYFQKK